MAIENAITASKVIEYADIFFNITKLTANTIQPIPWTYFFLIKLNFTNTTTINIPITIPAPKYVSNSFIFNELLKWNMHNNKNSTIPIRYLIELSVFCLFSDKIGSVYGMALNQ